MNEPFDSLEAEYLQQILEPIPAMLLVVDQDVRIQLLNAAAREGLHLDPAFALGKRGGEALQCSHAMEHEAGCGHAPACRSCAIRNAVNLVLEGGTIHRKSACLDLADGHRTMALHILVSAGLVPRENSDAVLLTIENVEELTQLRRLLPICNVCGTPRDDTGYRSEVAAYVEKHPGMDVRQGLCPECAEKYRSE
jgi:PAS domain-containing protein